MNPLRNVTQGEFGIEAVVHATLFDVDIDVTIEEGGRVDYAQKCADYLNSLPAAVIDDLCAASIRYCNGFLDDIGEPLESFDRDRDVLKIVYPSVLIVPAAPDNSPPVIHMELNCDWEEEHGLEWIIRNDKVLYVGQFTGEDPLRDFSVKHGWNYA